MKKLILTVYYIYILYYNEFKEKIRRRVFILSFEERRQYPREELPLLLEATTTIHSMYGKEVQTGSFPTLIKDVSLGGLRFTSLSDLPKEPSMILNFNMRISNHNFNIKGSIAWQTKVDSDLYEYGIQFYIDERTQKRLDELIDNLKCEYLEKGTYHTGHYLLSYSDIVKYLKQKISERRHSL